jgi:hypothetical protein
MKVKRISSNITNKPVQNYENQYGIFSFKFLNIPKISTLLWGYSFQTGLKIFLFSTNIQKIVHLSPVVLQYFDIQQKICEQFLPEILSFFSHDASDYLYTSKSASPILYKLESVSNQMSH